MKKIKGIYKHAQALKTGYCNQIIMTGFYANNTISIFFNRAPNNKRVFNLIEHLKLAIYFSRANSDSAWVQKKQTIMLVQIIGWKCPGAEFLFFDNNFQYMYKLSVLY